MWFYLNRYWGIEGTVVTAWLAVDDSDVKNGCLQVIPGTLQTGQQFSISDLFLKLFLFNQDICTNHEIMSIL